MCTENVRMVFPPSLTPRQRAALHSVGELYGLDHTTTEGPNSVRQISLGRENGKDIIIKSSKGKESDFSDADLIDLIQRHLSVDASFAFDSHTKNSAHVDTAANASSTMIVSEFVAKMEHLIGLERLAEVAAAEESLSSSSPEIAQAKGRALVNLRLQDAEGGLLGRTLLTLVRNKPGSNGEFTLPPHKLSPHDIIRLCTAQSNTILAQGVVYRVKDSSITIAVDDVPEESEGMDVPLRLEKLANEVTYTRLRAAMKQLNTLSMTGDGPAALLIEVLFGKREPNFEKDSSYVWTPVNSGLDESQKKAVNLALTAMDIALIQGPPGTGKTTTVVEIIAQEVARGSRVLACAASNIAVDNLVERIATQKLRGQNKHSSKQQGSINVVRVGHPARLLPAVLDNSLEAKVLRSDDSALARDCRKEIKDLNSRLLKLNGRKDRAERNEIRKDLRRLAKEERQRQEKAIRTVLTNASVICTTLTGIGSKQLADLPPFDVVVIDEAAQALEPACWAAALCGRRLILAGDHKQLPPTVTSDEAAKKGLEITLFERVYDLWGAKAAVMLTVQYRMNFNIMAWSSQEMYQGKLTAHDSVAHHSLSDLVPEDKLNKITDLPVLLLVDTAGCEMEEQIEDGGESKLNRGEAQVVISHVSKLIDAGIQPAQIGIIAPYSAQVGVLKEMREEAGIAFSQIEISTVDGFQGREKECIIISMVRSNTNGEVGFLSEQRRMNVAVTRARRHCTLVCDTDTIRNDPFLKRLIDYFEEHGEYASAQEY